jgi:hypothetical protein
MRGGVVASAQTPVDRDMALLDRAPTPGARVESER